MTHRPHLGHCGHGRGFVGQRREVWERSPWSRPTPPGCGCANSSPPPLRPGESRLVALDWWNGNRIPHGDALLSGLFIGLTLRTTGAHLYRALLESLCFGARSIVDHLLAGGAPVERVVLTSGLSLSNPLLMQMMADVLGREVEVPQEEQLTAVGGAIHGAVAAGVAADFREAARRYGATELLRYRPAPDARGAYDPLYRIYRDLGADPANREAMHALADLEG